MKIKQFITGTKYGKYLIPAVIAALALILVIPLNGEKEAVEKTTYVMLSDELEEKIESLCKSVDGIRYAKVLVTLDTSEEYVFAKDTEKNGEYYKITTSATDRGGIELYVISPRVRGAAVVCTGGDNPKVKMTVTELVSSALGIDTTKIAVAGS